MVVEAPIAKSYQPWPPASPPLFQPKILGVVERVVNVAPLSVDLIRPKKPSSVLLAARTYTYALLAGVTAIDKRDMFVNPVATGAQFKPPSNERLKIVPAAYRMFASPGFISASLMPVNVPVGCVHVVPPLVDR